MRGVGVFAEFVEVLAELVVRDVGVFAEFVEVLAELVVRDVEILAELVVRDVEVLAELVGVVLLVPDDRQGRHYNGDELHDRVQFHGSDPNRPISDKQYKTMKYLLSLRPEWRRAGLVASGDCFGERVMVRWVVRGRGE